MGTLTPAQAIIMVGLDGSGKTSLLNRLHRRELPVGVLPLTVPTIGINMETIPYGRHRLTIRDYGGQKSVRGLVRFFFRAAQAFIFVVDATAPERFPEAKEEFHRGLYNKTWENNLPILILANKMDLAGAADLPTIAKAFRIDLDYLKTGELKRAVAMKGVSAMSGE